MKHFVLFLLFSFFIIFNMDVNAKVEQSLNEYKIEQLQKGIDNLKKEIEEIKKDVDDTKEKKIENKKDNESLDKRIGDINLNITIFAIFITVLLLGFGFFGYRNAKADAKKEAEDTTKNWLEKDGKESSVISGGLTGYALPDSTLVREFDLPLAQMQAAGSQLKAQINGQATNISLAP